MADEKTRADSLRMYMTGAGSDGGAQTDPDACLGNYRSSTECTQLGNTVTSPISNVTINHVNGANGVGDGTLAAASVDTLKWTAPSGTLGDAVTIANGETKVLEDGAEPEKCIRVTRSSATDLSGTATVSLAEEYNNLVGFDNISSAEASAGDDEYRCICVKNESTMTVSSVKAYVATLGTQVTTNSTQLGASGAGTITTTGSFADWGERGFAHVKSAAGATKEIVYYNSRTATALTVAAAGRGLLGTSATAGAAEDTTDHVAPIRLAKEAPTGSSTAGYAETIADEDTAPAATMDSGCTLATGLDIGTLLTGEIYFIWIHRHAPVGQVSDATCYQRFNLSYEAA